MARRSLERDKYEARMELNPERKAALLAASPFRKHRKMVKEMLEKVERAKTAFAESTQVEDVQG